MFNVPVDPTLIAILSQLFLFIWTFSSLHQRVKELEKGLSDNRTTNKELQVDLKSLSLVVARSDEKLVQLVRETMYANGNTQDSPPKRRRKPASS